MEKNGLWRISTSGELDVCVEDHVRGILESFGALSAIEFDGVDVRWI